MAAVWPSCLDTHIIDHSYPGLDDYLEEAVEHSIQDTKYPDKIPNKSKTWRGTIGHG